MIEDGSQGETRLILLQALRRRRRNREIEAFLARMVYDPQLASELRAWVPTVK